MEKKLVCAFCGSNLGSIEKQKHDNPNYAEFRTCLGCGHQWAKGKWDWLQEQMKEG